MLLNVFPQFAETNQFKELSSETLTQALDHFQKIALGEMDKKQIEPKGELDGRKANNERKDSDPLRGPKKSRTHKAFLSGTFLGPVSLIDKNSA